MGSKSAPVTRGEWRVVEDAARLAERSDQGEPPSDLDPDPIEDLLRIVGDDPRANVARFRTGPRGGVDRTAAEGERQQGRDHVSRRKELPGR